MTPEQPLNTMCDYCRISVLEFFLGQKPRPAES